MNRRDSMDNSFVKTRIEEMNLYDTPMLGLFSRSKEFTAYTVDTLADVKVKNLKDMSVHVEDVFSQKNGKRGTRMDVLVKIKDKIKINIEIQRLKNKDELMRALNYMGTLLMDYKKGEKKLEETINIVILICAFDPFEGTEWEGQTRMSYVLKSIDDSTRFHTIGDAPYPFDGIKVMIYNGNQDWEKNKPRSKDEEAVKVFLTDMRMHDPEEIVNPVAKAAVKEYKEDPDIMDKTRQWFNWFYRDELQAGIKEGIDRELDRILKERLNETTDRVTKEVTEQVTKDVTEQVTKDVTEQVTKDVTEQVTKDVTEQVTKDVTESVVIDTVEKLLLSGTLSQEQIADILSLPLDKVKEIKGSMKRL